MFFKLTLIDNLYVYEIIKKNKLNSLSYSVYWAGIFFLYFVDLLIEKFHFHIFNIDMKIKIIFF